MKCYLWEMLTCSPEARYLLWLSWQEKTSHDKNNLHPFTLHAHTGARASYHQQANMAMKKKIDEGRKRHSQDVERNCQKNWLLLSMAVINQCNELPQEKLLLSVRMLSGFSCSYKLPASPKNKAGENKEKGKDMKKSCPVNQVFIIYLGTKQKKI